MVVSSIKVVFPNDIKEVWETVTSLTNYSWRSDLGKIETVNENKFLEYSKGGYATAFTVTARKDFERWEFDMENENMRGHWTGIFTQKDGNTEIEFTENIEAKKLLMKPFVKSYLKKQQSQYVSDLRKALSR